MSALPTDFLLHDGYALRAFADHDVDELHEVIERNRPRLARWISWARDQTYEGTLAFLQRAQARERDHGGLSRGIVFRERLVGALGITVDQANRAGELGYWLDEAHEGRGVMSAAVATVSVLGFERLRLNRLEIRMDADNGRSRAVAERLGFQFEGILRQSYRVDDDLYSDDAVYSMLASDAAREQLARSCQLAQAASGSSQRSPAKRA